MLSGTQTIFTNETGPKNVFTGTVSTGFIITNNTPSDLEVHLTATVAVIAKAFSSEQFTGATGAITATAETCDGFETTGEFYFINL